ncbi:hypothetical protein K7X08_022481 [Anisodus acutangulus]|uniref:Uncharacterized protein n=1 Tax=Anisodus acutangulus TaxID=402998 RepID=A0A9Q1MI35_9SOLA|nr:hypothetical protein K7X08_022481 [Anisodus acutangulus]
MRKLLSLFHPLPASASAAAAPHPLAKVGHYFANVDMPKIMPTLAMEDQAKAKAGSSLAYVPPPNTIPALDMEHQVMYSSMATSVEDPYMTRMQHVHPPSVVESMNSKVLSMDAPYVPPAMQQPPQESIVAHNYYSGPSAPYVSPAMQQTPQESIVTHNYYSGPSAPYVPLAMQQPPQESIVTHNYYSGPSAPYVPPVMQQYASEAIMQQGTSSISFEYSVVRRLG